MTVVDDDAGSDLASLAGRLLDEEAARTDASAADSATAADEILPGVGGAELSLREVLRAGGASTAVVLTLLNIVDEFDRIAMAILGPDIQRTFGLNDTGLAALGGVGAVAVFCGAVPLGLLADRRRRTTLVGITASLWAVFALLGGLTRSAWQLGATRVVNGLGKGNGPVISSILSDRYPIEGRARVFALYGLGNPVGNLVGPLLAAGVAAAAGGIAGWRWSLMVLAIPALVLALVAFTLPEPPRGANEKQALGMADLAVSSDPVPMAAAFERLRKIKTFSALMSALSVLGLALAGAAVIFNLLLEREYGLDGVGRGAVASVTSLGGFIGLAIGARVSDRLFREDPARVMRFVAATFAALGVSYTAGIRMPEVWMLVVCHFVAAGCMTGALAASSALVPSIVPYRMRGVSFAVVGLYLVFVGGLIGGVLTGMLSDAVGGRTALTVLMPVGCFGATAYLWAGSRHVRHDIAMVAAELREEEAELARMAAGVGVDDLLQVRGLDVSYGQVQVLFDVAVSVRRGETLALLGTNGAGKSTLLRAVSGLTLPDRGVVRFEGRAITYTDPSERVRRGIVQVAGGKAVFGSLSVRENLLAGAHTFIWDAARVTERTAEVLDLFPALVPLLDQPAGTLSGGEQQMLGLAKALLLDPEVLLIDELSLGLAPLAVQEILATIDRLKVRGLTMVIVEQSINVALAVADRAVFMEKGRIRFEGRTADLLERDDLARAVFLWDGGRVIALVLSPEFILLGAITGLVYALLASGLVLIYRSTGIINFAFGELGALCAAVLAKLVIDLHWNFAVALAVVVLLGALLGAALELVVVRRLFRSSRLVLLVATIGASQLFFLIQLLLPLRTSDPRFPSPFDREVMFGSLLVSGKHFLAIAVVPAVVAMLAVFLTRTPQGIAIRAAADNPDAAELAGISAKRVSTLVWTLGGALAALTVVLYNPLRGVLAGVPQPALGPGLLLRALAAALIGRLVSLPWALAGGVAIGVVEALLFVNSSNPGAADAVLFALVLGLLLVRGASTRDFRIDGFVPTPRTAPVPPSLRGHPLVRRLTLVGIGAPLLAAALLPFVFTGPDDIFLFSRVLIFALAAVSVTVLVGWAGQLSLGHFAFVGLGAMVTGALVGRGLSFPAALGYAMVAGAGAGVLVGAPALRLRGLFLAVTTLAFAIAASNWLFQLEILKGKSTSLTVPRATVLGVDLAPQRSYYWFCLVLLVVVGAAVSHWRGTGIGRGLIAVRENEDRASSLTLSPALLKLGAFAFSAAIAGLAGGLLAGLRVSYAGNSFGPELSLQLVAMVIIGGLGTVSGVILGAVYIVGLPTLFDDSAEIALLTSGAGLLVLLLYLPGGLISVVFRVRDSLLAGWATRLEARGEVTDVASIAPMRTALMLASPNGHHPDVDALAVHGVRVRRGGRLILPGVDLRIAHGETVGLIGANGAGKSTLMSALSGHLTVEAGAIEVYGTDVASQPAHRRARMGVGRIFQDARLFGDLTVTESIQVALEARERSEFVPSLLSLPPSRRAERRKVSDAAELVTFLGLGRYAEHRIATLSTGSRRIVELACLMAQDARLLLLDEPTSGVAEREAEAFAPLIAEIRRELDATVVIIEHDIPLVTSMSDRLYCLAVGEVIAEGEPDAVRRDPAVIAAYLGTDERAIRRSGATSVLSTVGGGDE